VTLVAGRASAACYLPRPLVLPADMDLDLRCQHDEDNNGLDDEMEVALGQCLAPRLVFHGGYFQTPAAVVSNMHAKDLDADGNVHLKLQYELLWASDGGFETTDCETIASDNCLVGGIGIPGYYAACYASQVAECNLTCGNSHVGDAQTFTLHATLRQGERWSAVPTVARGFLDWQLATYHFRSNISRISATSATRSSPRATTVGPGGPPDDFPV